MNEQQFICACALSPPAIASIAQMCSFGAMRVTCVLMEILVTLFGGSHIYRQMDKVGLADSRFLTSDKNWCALDLGAHISYID